MPARVALVEADVALVQTLLALVQVRVVLVKAHPENLFHGGEGSKRQVLVGPGSGLVGAV